MLLFCHVLLFFLISSVFGVLQNNVMVFIAELFWWFEIVKPDFVQPWDLQDIRDGMAHFLPSSISFD